MFWVILVLSVSPRIDGRGKLSLEKTLVDTVNACANVTACDAIGKGGGSTLTTLGAAAGMEISACQLNTATEIEDKQMNSEKNQSVVCC